MILVAGDVGDALNLARLHAQAFERAWSAAAIAELMRSPGVDVLMAAPPAPPGGAPAGFVMLRAVLDEAEILTLCVDAAARRAGVGAALVEAACAAAGAAGAGTIWLEVAADNTAALALYAVAGFEPGGRRRGYYARGAGAVDALVLRRALNSAPL